MVGVRKDGGEFPLELSMANWKAGEKIFFTGILRDITERKIIEERTRHLASFPQHNPNPIVEVDGSGRIAFWNPAAEKMLESQGRCKRFPPRGPERHFGRIGEEKGSDL